MPRFYFHIHDGARLSDREGTDLPSWREAKTEAVRLAGALIADNAEAAEVGTEWSMEVTDDLGVVLFRLVFNLTGTAKDMGSMQGD